MSKDIWHTGKEIPDEDQYIVVKNNMGLYTVSSEFEYDFDRVEKWAYFDDFLALETENKDLSDKIGKLEIELEKTRKALETLQEFIAKLYLSGKITDEQLERYKKMLITALEQKDK